MRSFSAEKEDPNIVNFHSPFEVAIMSSDHSVVKERAKYMTDAGFLPRWTTMEKVNAKFG